MLFGLFFGFLGRLMEPHKRCGCLDLLYCVVGGGFFLFAHGRLWLWLFFVVGVGGGVLRLVCLAVRKGDFGESHGRDRLWEWPIRGYI